MTVRKFKEHTPLIPQSTFVDEAAVIIGDVKLGEDCSVWPTTVIRGDVHKIRIGERTNVQDGSVLHVTHYGGEYKPEGSPLTIGDDVTIGHAAVVHACTIGNRCLIGMHSTVLDEAIIEDDVMLGAHSLVTSGRVLESGHLYAGSPARKIRPLTDDEIRFLKYSAKHYCKLKDEYLQEG